MSGEHALTVSQARSLLVVACAQRERGQWLEARTSCGHVLQCSHKLYNASASTLVAMAEQLLAAGRVLNSLMDFARGGACLDTALNLLLSPDVLLEAGALACLCDTFACLAHTYLHKQQLERASSLAAACRRVLLAHSHRPLVQRTVGLTLLELGLAHLDGSLTTGAVVCLERARAHLRMLVRPPLFLRVSLAKVHSALGYCYMCAGDVRAHACLAAAVRMWRALGWPVSDCHCVLSALKYCAEVRLRRDGAPSPPQGKADPAGTSAGGVLPAPTATAAQLAADISEAVEMVDVSESGHSQDAAGEDVDMLTHVDVSALDAEMSAMEATPAGQEELWMAASIDLSLDDIDDMVDDDMDASAAADKQTCADLLSLHAMYARHNLCGEVPDTLSYLGSVALHRERPVSAVLYFSHAVALCRRQPLTPDQLRKLLRLTAISSYNCERYKTAVACYREYLSLLEAEARAAGSDDTAMREQIAECCASLGFTYARLRHFDNMLLYYERALLAPGRLRADDRELIETNIGGLYHVKAARTEAAGDAAQAAYCYERAEQAFAYALRYTHRSFPFISYGYYLLWRGRYVAAAAMLDTAFTNGVRDRDTVEFDRAELPILLPDLRAELVDRDDLRVPATVIALYLRALAEARQPDMPAAGLTLQQLAREAHSCHYDAYFVENYGTARMRALAHSLLGYAYAAAGDHGDALAAFQQAVDFLPGYRVALNNVAAQKAAITGQTAPAV